MPLSAAGPLRRSPPSPEAAGCCRGAAGAWARSAAGGAGRKSASVCERVCEGKSRRVSGARRLLNRCRRMHQAARGAARLVGLQGCTRGCGWCRAALQPRPDLESRGQWGGPAGKEGDACAGLCPAATSLPGGVSLLFLISAKEQRGAGDVRRRLGRRGGDSRGAGITISVCASDVLTDILQGWDSVTRGAAECRRAAGLLQGLRVGTGSVVSSGAPSGLGPAATRSWSCVGQPGAPRQGWGWLSLEPAPGGSQLQAAPWHCSGPELCVPVPLLGASSFRAWVRGVLWAALALAAWGALALFWLLPDPSVCNKGCGERV